MKPRFSPGAAVALTLISLLVAAPAAAHPLITEPVAPLGRLMFESGFAATFRSDAFREPKTTYETSNIPFEARLGVTDRLDVGVTMNYLSQRLRGPEFDYKGSRTAVFNPELKYAFNDIVGLQFIYHNGISEEGAQELSIARGDDYELKALFRLPLRVPIELNLGYLFRNDYFSTLGIRDNPKSRVKPGDIALASLAAEIPIHWHIALLAEGAYYSVQEQTVAGVSQEGSKGTAADALVGLTWTYAGWNIGSGVAFGLLDESHTSFDLERGAGDYQLRFRVSYRLKPRKPDVQS